MASRNLHYRWQWQLKSTPEQLWPYVADTNRYNRDVKIPSIQRREQAGGRLPNARQPLRLILFGLRVEWDEEPFEWVWPQGFSVIRRYKSGPIAELRGRIQLRPLNGGGTELTVEADARPANLLGHVVIPLQIGMISGRKADRVYRRYDQLAQARDAFSAVQPKQLKFVLGGEQRLAQFAKQLQEDGASAALISLLIGTVQEGDQIALSRMRPYALADAWDQPRREVLELCLMATRVGMLQFRWELLCPLCRGPKQTATSLGEVGAEVHCDACNIDFSVNFDRSVELMFQPTPSVRDIEERPYCMGGPQLTPHIIAQKLISSGESVTWQPALEAGRYRLRALELPGSQSLNIKAGGRKTLALQIRDGWNDDEPEVALQPTISVENKTDGEQVFVLERSAWTDDAATAAEVTVLQRFRDLFSNEALRPGERISVGSLTISVHRPARLHPTRSIGGRCSCIRARHGSL